MRKALSLLIAVIMITAAAAAAVPASTARAFSDVEDGRWSAGSIEYAVKSGYMQGVEDDRFDPEGALTRAMAATVLWRREGEPAPAEESGFSDVPVSEWYADAVAWAKEVGVVKGLTETAFGPDEFITREQLCTMLYRLSSAAPVSVPERADLSPFADGDTASGWAAEPLGWAVEAGLIRGTDGGRLAPDGFATREQFAAIIERYDGSFKLEYNEPMIRSRYTEPEYPPVDDADYYVSTTGSDENDGSFDHPFATWERARDEVRALDKTGRDGITVAFFAGNYGPLSIELTKEDSGTAECPVTYCKYGDGDVVFDNGFTVTEDEFVPLDAEDGVLFKERFRGEIKKADISDRLIGYDPVSTLILSDDGMCTLARFPNVYDDGSDQLIRGAETVDDNHIVIKSALYKNRIKDYRTTDGLILYGYITLGWFKDFIPTDGYEKDPDTGDYIFYIPHPEDTRGGHLRYEDWFATGYYQFSIVNISEELDSEGEYWIDPDTLTMYVYSPKGSYNFCGGDSNMVRMKGTEYITFKGLDFRNSNKTIINATDHPRGFTIELCRFSGCTEENMNVIDARKKGVPLDLTVRNCEFSLSAGRALYIWGINKEDLFGTGTGVVVDNNLFTLTSLKIGLVAALAVKSSAPLVTHNEFIRCYWQCIDFGKAVNMLCEYNVFDQACCNGDDTAAMGKWYEIEACGNVIRYNLFMNITGGTGGRFSIYLDDGAVGADVVNNLFYNVAVTTMSHRGRYVSFCDNVVVKGPGGCNYDTGDTQFTEEAMAAGDLEAFDSYGPYQIWVKAFEYFDSHPSIKAQAMEYWPGLFEITTDLSRWNERAFCLNESLVITGNRWIRTSGETAEYSETLMKYSTIEDNIGYKLDENPLFVNPTLGDYRIRSGVDFPDIRFEYMGRY